LEICGDGFSNPWNFLKREFEKYGITTRFFQEGCAARGGRRSHRSFAGFDSEGFRD
jgi:hypothetical protein